LTRMPIPINAPTRHRRLGIAWRVGMIMTLNRRVATRGQSTVY
jgi:hypothetical protein